MGMEQASLSSELLSREPLTLSAAISRQTSAVCHVLLKRKVRRYEQPFPEHTSEWRRWGSLYRGRRP